MTVKELQIAAKVETVRRCRISEELLEIVAKAIASADERNGGPPYEMRVAEKHAKAHLFDEAEAAVEALRDLGWGKRDARS